MKATIFEIKRFAVHDGDGIRTTVFFKGCPLKCVWCHNPEGLKATPEIAFYEHKCIGCGECQRDGFAPSLCLGEARVPYGREVTVEELLPSLLEDRDFYENSEGGVTLSGGECLCQAAFCEELLRRLKENGIHTAVDTSGFVARESIERVLPYTDVFLYDLKAFDAEVHKKCTGVDNKKILENLRYLNSVSAKVEIRIPYVPEYNDTEMEKLAEFLKDLSCVTKMRVLPYHNYASSKYKALGLENTLPLRLPSYEEIEKDKNIFRKMTSIIVID